VGTRLDVEWNILNPAVAKIATSASNTFHRGNAELIFVAIRL